MRHTRVSHEQITSRPSKDAADRPNVNGFSVYSNYVHVHMHHTHKSVTNKLRHDPAKTQSTDQMSMASQCTPIHVHVHMHHTQMSHEHIQSRTSKDTVDRPNVNGLSEYSSYVHVHMHHAQISHEHITLRTSKDAADRPNVDGLCILFKVQ